MKHSVRCRHCRHRATLPRKPDEYANGIGPTCKSCGKRIGWRLEPYHYPSRKRCTCDAVIGRDGPYPHEPSHPLCVQNPDSMKNAMVRAGADSMDVAFELGGTPCESADAPF